MPLFKCSSSKSTPRKAIAYITDPNKAELISVRNLFEDEDYASQFDETAKRFGKGTGYNERKYYHIKLSCARQDNVRPQTAQKYAEEMAELLFRDHECVIATHTDTKTVHSHIIVNSVDTITGKKLHINSDEYAKMKDEANRIGKKYGFSELNWRKGAKHKRTSEEKHIMLKGGTSWKEELREVIQEGIMVSHNEEEFISYLQTNYGVEITRKGKDFSYLHPQKKKAIRGQRLGTNYTKSEVLKKIGKQNNRQETAADYRRRRRDSHEQSGTYKTRFGGGRVKGSNAGWLISEGIGAIEREMQQLNQTADYANRGLDAASEERKREQQRKPRRLETLISQQAAMKTETVQEVQIATGKVIKAGVEMFSAKIDEETKEVKNKLKDAEKEIEQAKSDIYYERGFRKFFFWATPVLLAVQTAISIILLLK